MDLRDCLLTIEQKHGRLTPALVVDEARDAAHPLHVRFEWDDVVAAEAHRRAQAHELIRSVRVTYSRPDGSQASVRAFHPVRQEIPENGGFVYEPLERIVNDPFKTKLLLADMEREWKTLRARYEHFEEFWQMVRGEVA